MHDFADCRLQTQLHGTIFAPGLARGLPEFGGAFLNPVSRGAARGSAEARAKALHHELERRAVIPTAFREDYLLALRALSRERRPQPLLRMLDRAQAFTSAIDFTDLQRALTVLQDCGAFESGESARLRMPG